MHKVHVIDTAITASKIFFEGETKRGAALSARLFWTWRPQDEGHTLRAEAPGFSPTYSAQLHFHLAA